MRLIGFCLTAALAAPAAEPVLPDFAIKAGEGGGLSLLADAPSHFRGGVDVAWSGILVQCDALSFVRTPYAGSREPILAEASLVAGPKGPQLGDRQVVVLDSSLATMPTIAFKGRLTPGVLHLTRSAGDANQPNLVRFRMSLAPLGDFAGQLRNAGGWQPYRGWAERAEAEVVAEVQSDGLRNPRFATILLLGVAGDEQVPRRRAWMVGPSPTRVGAPQPERPTFVKAEAIDFTICFDEQGTFTRIQTGNDFAQFPVDAEGNALLPPTPAPAPAP
jgi:hypothetical protein